MLPDRCFFFQLLEQFRHQAFNLQSKSHLGVYVFQIILCVVHAEKS